MSLLDNALQIAQSYTWDQTHGYVNGGMGYPDFDCSGFVGRCLYEAGFNYPSGHIGTVDMDNNPMSAQRTLENAGFDIIPVTDLNNIPPVKHGDIIVCNSFYLNWQGRNGHTFFYAENIQAYTDANADYDTVGLVSRAKIEASGNRGHTASGDSKKNGTGAYWEVWTHAYYNLIDPFYDPQDTNYNNFVSIARWPVDNESFPILGALLLFSKSLNDFRRL